jgi:hypothetical protein
MMGSRCRAAVCSDSAPNKWCPLLASQVLQLHLAVWMWLYSASHLNTNISSEYCTRTWFCCACNETNLMHYLSSVYSVTIPLHVSGLLVAHHQEVAMYIWTICMCWPTNSQLWCTTRTNCHIYALLLPDDGAVIVVQWQCCNSGTVTVL